MYKKCTVWTHSWHFMKTQKVKKESFPRGEPDSELRHNVGVGQQRSRANIMALPSPPAENIRVTILKTPAPPPPPPTPPTSLCSSPASRVLGRDLHFWLRIKRQGSDVKINRKEDQFIFKCRHCIYIQTTVRVIPPVGVWLVYTWPD